MRTGILGGTFNPVHNAHLRHAIEVGESLGLERVLLTPCATPPHKTRSGILPFNLRVQLLQAAVQDIPLLEVNTLEGELTGPSYTYDSLREWNRRHNSAGDGLPYFMMGAESFAALDTWKHGLELPRLARLVMVPRGGEDGGIFYESIRTFWPGSLPDGQDVPVARETVELAGGGCCTYLPVPRLDISATFVRARWLSGRSIAGLVPQGVLALLEKYRDDVTRCWTAFVSSPSLIS